MTDDIERKRLKNFGTISSGATVGLCIAAPFISIGIAPVDLCVMAILSCVTNEHSMHLHFHS